MSLKLIICLACFTLLSVIVVWVIQIFISDTLYENVRNREIDLTANNIRDHVMNKDMDISDQIDEYANDYDICIGLYHVGEKEITEIHSSIVFIDNIIYKAPDKMLTSFHDMAKQNGGVYRGRFGFDFFKPDAPGETSDIKQEDGMVISAIYAEAFVDESGNEYLLLLNSTMTPMGSAKKTFGAQFGYTMVILLIVSVFMGYILYRLISKPLRSMNDSAKELAKGRYDVKFEGGGYREIDELSDTLNYAASELAKNDNLQKGLIANISHDLRTPLTMIKGYSEIMRDIPGENTPENIQAIIDETTRLSDLVNDILDISKIESGTENFEAERFDLTAAVSEVICRYDKMKAVRSYDIRFDYESNVTVFADRGMILQVVYNLINNAINYSGDDKFVGVTQTVKIDGAGNGFVKISVTDHGVGIEKDNLPLIWDRYYKVDSVHKRAKVGSGLGLSIVKKVLEKHGAAYGVDSTVGEGSVFWFELPVSKK